MAQLGFPKIKAWFDDAAQKQAKRKALAERISKRNSPSAAQDEQPVRQLANIPAEEMQELVEDLIASARYGDVDDVKEALDFKVDVDGQGNNGNSALHMASANGHAEIVKILLASGATVDLKNEPENTAMHWAALNGHIEVVTLLLDAKADGNARNAFKKRPFDEAESKRHSELCELLAPRTDMSNDITEEDARRYQEEQENRPPVRDED
eukprot:gnl/MRDRNA2_/MRDRNA2_91343_c0_seq1.p1 gnl/MRDRNA2_/MRDRNA2_91343_c0~~gnl/MRDRNA2_/MRDRNA2_91343_c0_seq1.p1  ORF type:complete len:210 (-),score=61.05 gnl/MRDRNA2_/MRDRNA2_91343_c0_seq1:57-686(-)